MGNSEREVDLMDKGNAFFAAQKTIQSAKELPLSILNLELNVVQKPAFTDEDGNPAMCMTRKFVNLEQIKYELERDDVKTYVYKLYELQKHGMDLKPTGETFYHARYCVRRID